MRLRQLGLGLAVSVLASVPARGAVLISEVVFNEVSSDTTGEWIEIYNNGSTAVDLTNYKIGDEETSGQLSTTEALFQFPSGASIAAGQVQIVAVSATRFFTVYGVNPTYESSATDAGVPDLTIYATWDTDGGQINMSNTNDQAVLVDGTDTVIDAASWGNTFAFNPGLAQPVLDGQSYERINANVDTNTANDWRVVGDSSTAAAQRSTPFVVSVPEPTFLGIVALGGLLGIRPTRRQA